MSYRRVHSAQHTVRVAAPAGVVYGLLADASRWPVFAPRHVHVERMDFDGTEEHLRVWEVAGGQVRSTLARRVLRPHSRSIEFEQQDALWPGLSTAGRWSVEAQGEERALVTLRHERPPAGPGDLPDAVEAGVRAQLAWVRQTAGAWDRLDELLLSFEDGVRVEGPGELVYDFLYRIEDWAGLIPHVERARVTEDQPGVQVAALDTCAEESGRTVGVETVRLCFPHAGRIVYKETVTPELIAAHSGEWYLVPDASGVTVVSAHHVMLREEAVEPLLGQGATLLEARRHVREWLGRASTETLALAKWHAESAVHRLR